MVSQRFSVQALLALLSIKALLGSTVSVEVTASEPNSSVDVGEGPPLSVKGATVVKGANPTPVLGPGEALRTDVEDWL